MDSQLESQPAAVDAVVEAMKASYKMRACITALRHLPKQLPQYAEYPASVPPRLVEVLRHRGIERLYSHQATAIDLIGQGKNVVIVTPTASGKTLCYNVPVLSRMLDDPDARALYLFPTKALSQDQVAELDDLVGRLGAGVGVYTYDGDTPAQARKAIRTAGRVVVTNPDMLHMGILPHHTKWVLLFQNLRYVVVDEIHQYRGVFGSHVANVLRRLKRICEFYGSSPQFVCCSATIANPGDLAAKLVEEPVELVDNNGAPTGPKQFLFVNPPVVNRQLGIRASYLAMARRVALGFLREGVQTILFAMSRLNVEVLVKYLKDALERRIGEEGKIRGYRGGYLPNLRREIERGLREGDVLGVVSTNALELGVDIGGLDASVIAGYPGTIASTWQQAGRAGRRTAPSVVVLVGRSNPLDQFIMHHPDYFFENPPEMGLINPDNLLVLLSHVKCAAFELPFTDGERFGGEDLRQLLDFLADEGVLHHTGDKWHWMQDAYPADDISLRTVSADNFVVVDRTGDPRVLGEVDFAGALTSLYEGAIYMSQSEQYQVAELDYKGRKAYVEAVEADYYTDAITYTNVKVLDVFESEDRGGYSKEHGEVSVETRVAGYKKIKFYTMENVGYGKVNLPEQHMHTSAYWFTVREEVFRRLPHSQREVVDGLLGLSYLLQHLACFVLMCDANDLGRCIGDRHAQWYVEGVGQERGIYRPGHEGMTLAPEHFDRFEPTVYLYDSYPGGIGFSQQLFEAHEQLLAGAREVIARCRCFQGCPSCVGPANEVGVESKGVAAAILSELLPHGEEG